MKKSQKFMFSRLDQSHKMHLLDLWQTKMTNFPLHFIDMKPKKGTPFKRNLPV